MHQASGSSSGEEQQHVTVAGHVHFGGTLTINVPTVTDGEIILIAFNTSSGEFTNTIINIPPHNIEEECVPASATTQRRERSFALLLTAAQKGDECDSESSGNPEWLTWVIVAVVLLAIIVSIAVAAVLYLRAKKRRQQSVLELRARSQANSTDL